MLLRFEVYALAGAGSTAGGAFFFLWLRGEDSICMGIGFSFFGKVGLPFYFYSSPGPGIMNCCCPTLLSEAPVSNMLYELER